MLLPLASPVALGFDELPSVFRLTFRRLYGAAMPSLVMRHKTTYADFHYLRLGRWA